MSTMLRPMTPSDHADVLALSAAYEHLTAPMDAARLQTLLGTVQSAEVIDHEGAFAGFVLTFIEDADYDSPNFRWFRQRWDRFTYLDRIIVHPDFHRLGLATAAYDEIEGRCRDRVLLEVNIEPPNEASLLFHERRGYVEVGRQEANGHIVSLQAKEAPRP